MSLKVWCVSYYSGFGYHDHSELFLTERKAKIFVENRVTAGCKDIKCCQVPDIWNYTARHFEEKIDDLLERRTSDEGCCFPWEMEDSSETLEEELIRTAAEAGIKDFSCDIWNVFESPGIDIYSLSCAWTYRGELKHYTDTLEVF